LGSTTAIAMRPMWIEGANAQDSHPLHGAAA
jgi:hypothetical protein